MTENFLQISDISIIVFEQFNNFFFKWRLLLTTNNPNKCDFVIRVLPKHIYKRNNRTL